MRIAQHLFFLGERLAPMHLQAPHSEHRATLFVKLSSFFPKMASTMPERPSREALWPHMCVPIILQTRVTAQEFNDQVRTIL